MKQFLAVDTGGSKTKAVVFGDVLAEYSTVGFGTAYESGDDIPQLRSFLTAIGDKHDICSIAVNLGGKNKNQIYTIASQCFPHSAVSVFRESEGDAAVSFGRSCGANAVLLAGTGTIGIAFDDERYIIGGGWGMNIGDGGSGYSIGLEAIRQSLAALDSCNTLTPLQSEITGLDRPISPSADTKEICTIRDGVRSRIFPIERRKVASYAKTVASHCEKGESDALELMKAAGREMAQLMSDCISKLSPCQVQKVAVTGGLVNVKPYWQEEFENILQQSCGVREFIYENDGILLGTRLIASEQVQKRGVE